MCEYVDILKVAAFGFTFELKNDRCFFVDEYEIYLNDVFHKTSNKNVVSIFALKPNTDYSVKIKSNEFEYDFSVRTIHPRYVINVKDYNATGDGVTCDTSAINLAIYTAPLDSVVYIPKGEYLVDQILLKSNVQIYLEKGAILRQSFSRNKLAILKGYQKDYDHLRAEINASWEGNPLDCYCSLIYGKNVEFVHIYGEGIIDGNGDIGGFWDNPKVKNVAFRPKNIFLVGCREIHITGITSRNSASWNIHPLFSQEIYLTDLKIESIEESPNTDGINPESCINIKIIGCHFSVGDDCIAIKAGKYFMTTFDGHPTRTEKITIRNCFMEKGHGAVVIGSEMSCGVYSVKVSQCLFKDTDRGLRIKTRRGRGKTAIVDGITFDNVQMEGVRHCFVVNMYYNCDPDGKSLYVRDKNYRDPDEFTPSIKNITVSNVVAKDTLGSAVFIYGLPESKVEGVKIINSHFAFVDDDKRVRECPAMMDDFEVTGNIDIFVENADYSY